MFVVLFAYLRLAWCLYGPFRLRQKKLIHELDHAMRATDQSLEQSARQRILFYTQQSALTNLWFSQLRGEKPNEQEEELALVLGAITPFVDDLNDEQQLTSQAIFAQLAQPVQSNENQEWTAVRKLYPRLKALSHPLFEAILLPALEAQDKSVRQWSPKPIKPATLKQLTEDKGGYATLLYRAVLQHPMEEAEKAFVLKLGFVLQLTNDLFDAYKDHQNGQQTLVNQTPLPPLLELYRQLCEELKQSLHGLAYPRRQRKHFWRLVVPLLGRGLVCVQQFEGLPLQSDGRIDFANCQRSDLICDMERVRNIWHSMRYSLILLKAKP